MNLVSLPTNQKKDLVDLVEQIKDVIYNQPYELSIVEAIGALEIAKSDIIEDARE